MGIGSAVAGALRSGMGKELIAQAEGAAVQQAGAQIGSTVINSPHALRQKLAQVEQYASGPATWGRTPIDGWFPSFTHIISVSVAGGPEASIKDVWKLAVATAFGRMRQRIATFAGVRVQCVWDITDKAVAMKINYGSNGLIPFLIDRAGKVGIPGIRGESAVEMIQRGPTQETVGGSWAGFLQTIPQLLDRGGTNVRAMGGRITPTAVGQIENPTSPGYISRSGGRLEREDVKAPPVLPDDGRLITTADYTNPNVQPPRPTDYTDFVALVSNLLTAPCFLPAKPTPGLQVDEPKGKFFYQPGAERKPLDRGPLDAAEKLADANLNRVFLVGLDGSLPPSDRQSPAIPNEVGLQPASPAGDNADPEA